MAESALQTFMNLDQDELLMQIGQLADPRAPLNNPRRLMEQGSAVVEAQLDRLRTVVCPRKDLIDTPEFEFGTVLVGLLVDHLTLGLASAVAAYVAKRGVRWLCPQESLA